MMLEIDAPGEIRGRWRAKPGSIMPDGSIVAMRTLGSAAYSYGRGVLWIETRRLAVAERFGWEKALEPLTPGGLVAVRR